MGVCRALKEELRRAREGEEYVGRLTLWQVQRHAVAMQRELSKRVRALKRTGASLGKKVEGQFKIRLRAEILAQR